ncbi:helix-turn-helix transcriptional regulator [Staphylococcus equorum]|uniref:helix-turn-helix transcriptional regulator n=1 Tax=Staphylococcus equorum TaxID=246432 RepID=UPI003EB98B9C
MIKNVPYPVLVIKRKEMKISQIAMSEKLGLTRVGYSLKERGIQRFSLEEAKILSDFFGMSIEDLMFGCLDNFLKEEA